MTADLAAWLLADDGPIAEDERVARAEEYSIACYDAARVLTDCAAKRQIIEEWRRAEADSDAGWPDYSRGYRGGLFAAIESLAQSYAGRDGWRDEWAL